MSKLLLNWPIEGGRTSCRHLFSESEFSKKADDLLKDAGERAGAISEGDAFIKESLKLVDEAKTLHAPGKDAEAYAKYIEALKKIESGRDKYML